MRLYNIFENDRKVYHHEYGRGYNARFDYDRQRSYNHHSGAKSQYAYYLLQKVWSNRKLRILLFLAAIVLVVIIILVIIFGLKLIGSLTEVIRTEGLKGITDIVKNFIDKLWTGA
jgi:hypothetical protein